MNELIRNDSNTDIDKYKPTPAEEKILEVCLNPNNIGKTVTEKMSIAGVCRETWYKAFRKPGFVNLINETAVDLVKEKVADILAASVEAATKGGVRGYQDRRMLLEMFGLVVKESDGKIVIVNIGE